MYGQSGILLLRSRLLLCHFRRRSDTGDSLYTGVCFIISSPFSPKEPGLMGCLLPSFPALPPGVMRLCCLLSMTHAEEKRVFCIWFGATARKCAVHVLHTYEVIHVSSHSYKKDCSQLAVITLFKRLIT